MHIAHNTLNYWGFLMGHEIGECAECRLLVHHPRCVTCRRVKHLGEPELIALIFPCAGNPPRWELSGDQIAAWKTVFPRVDVLAECKRAHAWVCASPANRKTAKGMGRFLVNWLGRATDRPTAPLRANMTFPNLGPNLLKSTDDAVQRIAQARERAATPEEIERLRKERNR